MKGLVAMGAPVDGGRNYTQVGMETGDKSLLTLVPFEPKAVDLS